MKEKTEIVCPKCGEKMCKEFWGSSEWQYTCGKCGWHFIIQVRKEDKDDKKDS